MSGFRPPTPTPEAHFPCPPDTALNRLANSQHAALFSHKLSPFMRFDVQSYYSRSLTHTQLVFPAAVDQKSTFRSGPEMFLSPVLVCVSTHSGRVMLSPPGLLCAQINLTWLQVDTFIIAHKLEKDNRDE